MAARPEVPKEWVRRIDAVLSALPQCASEPAWVGVRWRVGSATVAHVFGGEDGLFRITFRAEPDEVMAFEHLGPPYFRVGYGADVVGLLLDDDTNWQELAELLTESYCLRAPAHLAAQVDRPPAQGG
ncbi:MmcQ/YjbR family DNA-binding protein [Nocardioides sp. dk4132]|uniref:MmcQ/YjbR family DNA-binding protein n=1 Tax=unclassified Nocardioides TaxID=2615069 RepID=UPI0012956C11|nr:MULTISPECIES: MmcQ/YjbR family DNA-binding protein [unclassified Nocardioides]MQW76705.1 MmcQ/YjbR family DNA-binding protein [Nocardioides sp. dk4132]QGA06936.1 MmcQ/YjbR family DNA-binding protein [Nocardioides sp. dk884]